VSTEAAVATTTVLTDDDSLEARLMEDLSSLQESSDTDDCSKPKAIPTSTVVNPYAKKSSLVASSTKTSVSFSTDATSQSTTTQTNDGLSDVVMEASDDSPTVPDVPMPDFVPTRRDSVPCDPVRVGDKVLNLHSGYIPKRVVPTSCSEFIRDNEMHYDPDRDVDAFYNGPRAHDQVNPLPYRAHFGRYTWKVHAQPSDQSFTSLRLAILELWEVFLEADPTFVIYPWTEDDAREPGHALNKPSQCPYITRDLLIYFQKALPRASGGTYYIGVRFGSQYSPSELKARTAEFFSMSQNQTRVGSWLKSLQHDNTVEIGWLLGSTYSMSLERLAAEIHTRSNGALEIGCRWHAIGLKHYNPNLPDSQRFKAIHIEVKAEQQSAAIRFMGALFSKSRTKNFVMNTTMRFIPIMSLVSSVNVEAKVAHARERQGLFLHQLRQTKVFTIGSLDFKSNKIGNQSLRDLILKLKVDGPDSPQLYFSCDMQVDGGVLVTFLEKHNSIGHHKSQNLLAYLRYTNPPEYHDHITSCFMASAYAPADDVAWDANTQTVITPAEAVVLENIEEVTTADPFGYDEELRSKVIIDIDMSKLEEISTSSPLVRTRNLDDDSISTIRSVRKKTRFDESTKPPNTSTTPSPRPPRVATRSRSPSPISFRVSQSQPNARDDGSHHSEITMESRLSTLEQDSRASRNDMSSVKSDVREIFKLLQSLTQSNLASAQSNESSGAGRSS
jgi:hypothetical protein